MAISKISSAPLAAKPHAGPSAADLKTAKHLKTDILEVLKRVRFGTPLTAAASPKANAKGEWQAPNGDKLIKVVLSKPPAGAMGGMTHVGLVNPKTNQFYDANFGAIQGGQVMHGPMQLADSAKFAGKNFNAKDIEALTAAANGTTTAPAAATPGKTQILNALGTYEFHKIVKWGAKGPADTAVLKKVALKKENHPDGFTYTGLVLKSDPNKVVIARSGGIAGITQYTQPLDVTRLPR